MHQGTSNPAGSWRSLLTATWHTLLRSWWVRRRLYLMLTSWEIVLGDVKYDGNLDDAEWWCKSGMEGTRQKAGSQPQGSVEQTLTCSGTRALSCPVWKSPKTEIPPSTTHPVSVFLPLPSFCLLSFCVSAAVPSSVSSAAKHFDWTFKVNLLWSVVYRHSLWFQWLVQVSRLVGLLFFPLNISVPQVKVVIRLLGRCKDERNKGKTDVIVSPFSLGSVYREGQYASWN